MSLEHLKNSRRLLPRAKTLEEHRYLALMKEMLFSFCGETAERVLLQWERETHSKLRKVLWRILCKKFQEEKEHCSPPNLPSLDTSQLSLLHTVSEEQ